MAQRLTLTCILLGIAGVLSAGDIATFENLGFSSDSGVFLFGQYGLQTEEAQPFAEIYAVDVAGNRFLSDGVFSVASDAPLNLGQTGRGAFFAALLEAQEIIEQESIDHLETGRPIYIRVSDGTVQDRVTFRDFNTDRRYDVRIIQEQRERNDSISAAFYLDLTVTESSGATQTMQIGRPGFFREGVASYQITQMLVGPDERSLIVVIERRSPDGSVRYMVETTAL
jgi:predicted secreted protein